MDKLTKLPVFARQFLVAALLLPLPLACASDPTESGLPPGTGGAASGGDGAGGVVAGGGANPGTAGNAAGGLGPGVGGSGGELLDGMISPPFNPAAPVAMTPGWSGTIVAEYSENYTFRVTANAPVRALVNGEQILRDFAAPGPREAVGSIWLTAGASYELTVEADASVADPGLVVEWESPSKHRTLVPQSSLAEVGLAQLDSVAPFFNGVFPVKTPSSAAITAEPASGDLGLTTVMAITSHPNLDHLYVVGRFGPIKYIDPNAGDDRGTLFMDLGQGLFTGQDSGVMNMVFHPEYRQAGSPNRNYFYVFYVADTGNAQFVRVSRFTATEGQNSANRDTEQILIQERLSTTFHRGGGMTFGTDGFLYIGMGDFGNPNNGQDISDNLAAGILRIDVDQDPARSHAIPKDSGPGDDETYNQNYFIPNDNPFVGQAGVLEEYYALGERNPHRLTMDPITGRLFVGNVGGNTDTSQEEVNEVFKGGNYGWPFREGDTELGNWTFQASGQTFQVMGRPANIAGELTEPNLFLNRPGDCIGVDTDCSSVGDDQAGKCLIGGYVYRGSALPQLDGRYILSDCNIGTVWAATDDRAHGPMEVLLTSPFVEVVTFGQDKDGEVYFGGTDRQIFKLVPSGPPVGDPPALLSETGVFTDMATMATAPGVIPYGVSNPLWSDAAAKKRWLVIPNDGSADTDAEQIDASDEIWKIPVGAALVKHFDLEQADGSLHRLETRFLIHGEDDRFYGFTYRWRADNSDADLQGPESFQEDVNGQVWHYPSRSECGRCHNSAAGYVLGPKTVFFNSPLYYESTGLTANALTTLQGLGLFGDTLPALSARGGPSLHNTTAFAEERARAYLGSNCAHCHRPNGPGRGDFDARFTTPLAEQNLIGSEVIEALDIEGAQLLAPQQPEKSVLFKRLVALDGTAMPPLAKGIVDQNAVAVFTAWLDAMNLTPGPAVPTAVSDLGVTVAANAEVGITLAGEDADGDQLDYRIDRMPTHGTLEGLGKTLVYRPHPDFAGIDGFSFLVTDGVNVSEVGQVQVTVAAP